MTRATEPRPLMWPSLIRSVSSAMPQRTRWHEIRRTPRLGKKGDVSGLKMYIQKYHFNFSHEMRTTSQSCYLSTSNIELSV